MEQKSTPEEIRERFDKDIDRFSNLESGQTTTVDAVVSLELITETAKRLCPQASELLDIGCGAGNYTLKMLSKIPSLNCTLIDLSRPMLDRAKERVQGETSGTVNTMQGDIREVEIGIDKFDIIVAGAVLHHLRDDNNWESVFSKLYRSLKKGGCLLISDLVIHESEIIDSYLTERYTDYLTELGGKEFPPLVLACIEKEDTPRPVTFQLELMKKAGFRQTDVLHKNICFAAYCGIK